MSFKDLDFGNNLKKISILVKIVSTVWILVKIVTTIWISVKNFQKISIFVKILYNLGSSHKSRF